MIGDKKKSGIDPVVIFLLISLLIHGLLFYFIPKLHINLPKPKKKGEKPISVQLINEPIKGEKKPPKKATALGKENITVKEETRPENKPKVSGEKKITKPMPLPPPPAKRPHKPEAEAKKPEIKLAPLPKKPPAPPSPKNETEAKPKLKAEKKAKSVPKVRKAEKVKHKEKILATSKKAPVKIAKAVPKPQTPPLKKEEEKKQEKRVVSKKASMPPETLSKRPSPQAAHEPGTAPRTQVPPAPESLFPSAETLHQIERKFSHTYPKDVAKGDVISLNTRQFKYISYFTHIKHKIELVWEYPRAAAEMGQEGSLLLRFTILKDGRLGGVKLLRSSGYRLLDQEAIRAVKAAAPFNPIPDRLHKNRLNIIATFNYSLGFKFVY